MTRVSKMPHHMKKEVMEKSFKFTILSNRYLKATIFNKKAFKKANLDLKSIGMGLIPYSELS